MLSDGHQFSPLLTVPNQYTDGFFKSLLQGLINRKMVDIVRVPNKKRTRCEEYKAIDMTVNSLAVWHSYVGNDTRWVLGVRHDKESGVTKRSDKKRSSQIKCDNQVVQGGVCVKHGAIVKVRRCSQDGCDNHVVQGGVCIKHGAILVKCNATADFGLSMLIPRPRIPAK